MIIKIRENVEWRAFKRKSQIVKALQMKEDFIYETIKHGWVQGHKGQWLVELGEDLRCNLDDEAFVRAYKPARMAGGKKGEA